MIVLALALLFAPSARAGDSVIGADTFGRGGARVANGTDNSNITGNPGALGLKERYDFSAHFRFGGNNALQWSASAMDSMTARPVAFGLTYYGQAWTPGFSESDLPGWQSVGDELSNKHRGHALGIALALPTKDRGFSAGIQGDIQTVKAELSESYLAWDLGAGVAVAPTKGFSLGLAGRNLVPTPGGHDQAPTVIGGLTLREDGLGLVALDATGHFDEARDLPIDLNLGGELAAASARLRLGYRLDGAASDHGITAGLALEDRGAALDIGAQYLIMSKAFTMCVGLRFPGPSTASDEGPGTWGQ